MEIQLPRGVSGGVFPSAIVDSGVPLIVTSPAVANAIYGAIGISPAQDGQYYVPCNKPLNMTMTLDNRRPIPLHPLDLTADPPQDNRAAFCIGLIQVDAQLGRPNTIGDMILGVPFMRNVYTVMAYTEPNPDGTFPPISEDATSVPGNPGDPPTWTTTPRLGMLGITDPQIALEEFHTVRVLNKPLGDLGANGRNSPGADGDHNGTKPSTGVIVIIALVGAFVVCSLFFGIRWFITRRRYRKQRAAGMSDSSEQFAFQPTGETKRELLMDSMLGMATGGYQLANSTRYSRAPTDSIHTLRDRDGRFPDDHLSKFDSRVSSNRGTTYSGRTLKDSISSAARPTSLALDHSPRQSLDVVDAPMPPTSSSSSSTPINQPRHRPEGSVTSPLISSSAYDTPDNGDSNTPYYPPSAYPHRRHHHRDSSSSPSSSPPPNPHSTQPMAGVGTASRTKKLSMDLDSFNRRASGSVDSDREPGFAGFGSPTSVYSTPDASNKISIPVPPRARTKSNHTSDESTGSNSNYHHSRAVQSQDEMEMSPMLRRS
ncbi:hypothetical protein FA15DRAFT_697324 [Coprinopsis marcescibilis]|uniref:Peptidase A1 domain-containing protein n=1 Tax=Coprinopsis marcescibilis TaxID=230819 RepID=A0A5C3KIY6_COPMA|nr:hypothetical protein FA15DRAFT_697324 [Coprinopsis marcescibilis]